MKKIFIFTILISLLLSCSSPEERIAMEKLRQQKIEADRVFELQRLKIQAEIDNNKPAEVRVAEIKSQEISVWEWAAIATWIGAAAWTLWKVMEQ